MTIESTAPRWAGRSLFLVDNVLKHKLDKNADSHLVMNFWPEPDILNTLYWYYIKPCLNMVTKFLNTCNRLKVFVLCACDHFEIPDFGIALRASKLA